MKTLHWKSNCLTIIDQTKLPTQEEYIICKDYLRVAEAIKKLEVRGAPAIGAAAAYGMLLGALQLAEKQPEFLLFRTQLEKIRQQLQLTRPTAVNLAWALDKMSATYVDCTTVEEALRILEQTANDIFEEDVRANALIGSYGAALFGTPINVLTHCNAGSLATCGIGTALGVIKTAFAQGKIQAVYADETRPLLQGARLTSYELTQAGVPVIGITDNMAGWVMKQNLVQAVIVGADRIAANGDTANKIGTYSLAVLAKEHQIPFYIAAPWSTFDYELESGEQIVIEERAPDEVRELGGVQITPNELKVYNPAFDVTPHTYIAAIITEYGIIHRPNRENMLKFKDSFKKEI